MKTLRFRLTWVAVLLCTLMANAHDFEVDGIYYQVVSKDDLTVAVTYKGNDRYDHEYCYKGEVIVPERVTYNEIEYTVTEVGERAFMDCDSLISVSLPESIKAIDELAFAYCYNIEEVNMPSEASLIGQGAFTSCKQLTSITIPEGVTELYYTTFNSCEGLQTVILPNSLTTIKNGVFTGCESLQTIVLPESLISIGNYTFGYCYALESITIPASVTDIGTQIFTHCTNLKSLQVAEGNAKYDSRNNCNAIIETGSNKLITSCATTTIPDGVETIGTYAFSGITIPELVLPKSLETIEKNGIRNCTFHKPLIIPEGVKKMGEYALSYNSVDSIIVRGQITRIEKNTFGGCARSTFIDIPESVKEIADNAFNGCTSLKKLTCRAITPSKCSSLAFNGRNKTCILEVPEESLSLYGEADQWKNFSTIKAIGSADIVELPDPNRNIVKKGHATYYATEEGTCTYLYSFDFNADIEKLDDTECTPWNYWNVIVIDADTIGPNAFSGCIFRNGQVIYLTEKVKVICKDAFSQINIQPRITADAQITDNLTLVFEGTNPPNIASNRIMDNSYRLNFVVPDLATYISSDIQWTYTQIMTEEDLLNGRVSAKHYVYTFETTEADVVVDFNKKAPSGAPLLYASVRPRKTVPVRIGDEEEYIYSPAPIWQNYKFQIQVANNTGRLYFGGTWNCKADEECNLVIELSKFPVEDSVYLESRSVDLFNQVSEWARTTVHLVNKEPKPYLVTEGKEWAVYHHNPVCSAHQGGTITYKLQGDTILHGKTYKKRWMSYKEDLSDMQLCKTYMREEDGKVYTADAHGEQLWFDYTAQVGDTICFKEGYEYGRIQEISDALLAETDSTKSYRCYRVQLGKSNGKASDVAFADQYISVCEDLGVIGSFMGYGLCEHRYNSYGRCSFSLLCVHDNGQILYQTDQGCYVPIPEQSRPTNRKGYGIYYGDNYLVRYTINESEAINDTTDFSRWNDKTVIYFDVDSVGKNAFTNATFRQRRILYFTERLKYIAPDAFSNILMLDEEIEEEHPFGDLCIVFGGENPPAIEDNCIVNYADTTYRITYIVPNLTAYIENDIQWTYAQLVTIDDFIKGYVAPENEVIVSDSAGVDLDINVNSDSTNTDGSVTLYATARPKKEIPVRIGDKGSKDIISRAPAWMRYTIEVVMTDCQGDTLFAEKKLCNGYDACDFVVTLSHYPVGNIVNVYSRSIDQYGNASDWVMKKITLMSVDTITAPDTPDTPYYDLQGRKVAHPTRGIYIKDGKKVILN